MVRVGGCAREWSGWPPCEPAWRTQPQPHPALRPPPSTCRPKQTKPSTQHTTPHAPPQTHNLKTHARAHGKRTAQVNKTLPAEKQAKATSLYKKFIRDVEDVDYGMKTKDKDASLAAADSATKSLAAWKTFTTAA